jgi:hypothetical protein
MNFQFFEEHDLNSSLIHHQHQEQYLHIPVNASTWGKQIFNAAKFRNSNKLLPNYTTVIFFRDPIDRWLSGLSTWLTYRLPQHTGLKYVRDNQALLDTLFDTVRQDDHTERQTFFIQNVNLDKAKCFYMNDTFSISVNQYFLTKFNIDISSFPKENQTTLDGGKLIPKTYFRSVLESNTKYMHRVKEFFKIDYDFIKTANFENTKKVECQYYDF